MSTIIEELFNRNKKRIEENAYEIGKIKNNPVSSFTYSFAKSTLAEAQQFTLTDVQFRFITNARKSGEGAGLGTGLPAFYDPSSGNWKDFTGTDIIV